MWINHISQTVSRPSDYDTLVASSHDTYSVIHWRAGDQAIRLDRTGIYQYYTDEDTDYFYEYYEYGGTNMCTCLRASKHPTGSDTDIYAHKMATYDFYGVFNSNLKNPNIYSWHGNDECPSYYWHGYGDGTVDLGWCIVDGNLPFKYEFAERATGFDGYPNNLWIIHNDGYLPTKSAFATRAMIDDAPEALWRIKNDGRLPFKKNFTFTFPAIIDDAPLALWRMVDGELPHKVVFPQIYELDWYPPTTSWLQYAGYIPYRPWPGKVQIPNIIESVELPEIDWTRSMQQTFEYYTVDPETWYDVKRLDQITESNQTLDLTSETRGNASINTTEPLEETYIRTYMRCKQDGIEQRICLGTFLYMTSSDSFDGKNHKYQMTGYTPLVELREALPPIGYFIYGKVKKGDDAPLITEEIRKAIVNNTRCELEMNVTIPKPLLNNYVASTDANWLKIVNELLSAAADAKYMLTVDEWGTVQLKNSVSTDTMQPKFVYDDSNSSILLPDIDTTDDLFNIPNQVELIFTGSKTYSAYRFLATNDDEASPVSTVHRGRVIRKRYTMSNVSIPTGLSPTDESIHELVESQAYLLLETLSTVQKTISYSHGYCGTKVGDCILINYERAGLVNVKAVITSQRISCKPGCQVDETAVYTKSYYKRK